MPWVDAVTIRRVSQDSELLLLSIVYRSIPSTAAPIVPAKQKQEITMGLFTKDIKSMEDLFLHTLQDIYYAENKIVKSLPEMIETAHDGKLKQGLKSHLGETQGHVKRLEQVFQLLGQKPKEDKDVLDAAVIASAQAVEHYEITRYGSLIAWARQLGRNDAAQLFEQTLNEEKAADKKLTTIAESKVNLKAAS
jgi:ferritin-like metal-binding protein YciE